MCCSTQEEGWCGWRLRALQCLLTMLHALAPVPMPVPTHPASLPAPLSGHAAGEGNPTAWADVLYDALQAAELPLIRPGMCDASPGAPGLCCPGRAQRLLEAALQALAASPLELPKPMPAAGHLGMMSTLVLAVCGLADWALPQWAAAEAAGLADPPACLFCGR